MITLISCNNYFLPHKWLPVLYFVNEKSVLLCPFYFGTEDARVKLPEILVLLQGNIELFQIRSSWSGSSWSLHLKIIFMKSRLQRLKAGNHILIIVFSISCLGFFLNFVVTSQKANLFPHTYFIGNEITSCTLKITSTANR